VGEYTDDGCLLSKEGVPLFLIDVNIDGVQVFKNSVKSQAVPILGRVHSIDGIQIPNGRSPPFIIGMYHGSGVLSIDRVNISCFKFAG
jgi:hypothetical protein